MTKRGVFLILVLSLFILTACVQQDAEQEIQTSKKFKPKPEVNLMKIESIEFENNGLIPKNYTCDGQNIVPPLKISDIPDNALSLAIIVEDPDAPSGTFVHWVAYNIPPDTQEISGEIGSQGKNDFGNKGYNGPCPPPGTPHHYHFNIYALDKELDLSLGATKTGLLSAMQDHLLDQAELVGIYQR